MELLKQTYPLQLLYAVRYYNFLRPLPLNRTKLMNFFEAFHPKKAGKESIAFRYGEDRGISVFVSRKHICVSGEVSKMEEFMLFFRTEFLEMKRQFDTVDTSFFETKPFRVISSTCRAENVDHQFMQQHFTLVEKKPFLTRGVLTEVYKTPDDQSITIRYRPDNLTLMVWGNCGIESKA